MFHIRRTPPKEGAAEWLKQGHWAFLSEEFVNRHPNFSGQFWGVVAFVLIMVATFSMASWAAQQDREFHKRLCNAQPFFIL